MVPFALDERLEEDCLFFIFEEDFRFTPEPDDPAWKLPGRRDTSQHIANQMFGHASSPPPTRSGSASSSAAAAPQDADQLPTRRVEPTAHPAMWDRRVKTKGFHVQTVSRPPAVDWTMTSQLLEDMVGYGILMSRMSCQFAWLGWQPWGAGNCTPNSKPNKFGSGNMAVCMDKMAARRIEYHFNEDDQMRIPGHMDLKLKQMFCLRENLGHSCYITPPIGGYSAHLSGCAKEFMKNPRPTIWAEKFACPGTRRSHDWLDRDKWWATFTLKGSCDWPTKKPVNIEKMTKDDLAWKTWDRRKPPDDPEPTAWSLQSEKTNRKAREARMVMQRLTWRHFVDTEAEAARSMQSLVTHG